MGQEQQENLWTSGKNARKQDDDVMVLTDVVEKKEAPAPQGLEVCWSEDGEMRPVTMLISEGDLQKKFLRVGLARGQRTYTLFVESHLGIDKFEKYRLADATPDTSGIIPRAGASHVIKTEKYGILLLPEERKLLYDELLKRRSTVVAYTEGGTRGAWGWSTEINGVETVMVEMETSEKCITKNTLMTFWSFAGRKVVDAFGRKMWGYFLPYSPEMQCSQAEMLMRRKTLPENYTVPLERAFNDINPEWVEVAWKTGNAERMLNAFMATLNKALDNCQVGPKIDLKTAMQFGKRGLEWAKEYAPLFQILDLEKKEPQRFEQVKQKVTDLNEALKALRASASDS